MKNLVEAYYSLKTGNRVKAVYGKRNPAKVLTLSLDPNILRGSVIKIDADGMPTNLEAAKLAKAKWDVKQAQLEARRAAAKAKKVTKKAAKKAVKKVTKTSRVVKRDRDTGEFAKKTSRKKSVSADIVKAPKRTIKKTATPTP